MADEKPDPGPEIPGKCNTIKKDHTRCGQPAGMGTDHLGYGHCKYHLGTTANHTAHAHQLMAEEAVSKLGLSFEELQDVQAGRKRIDARDVLATELYRSYRYVRMLEVLVGDLGTELYGDLYNSEGGRTGRALPNVLYSMLLEERKHLTRVAAETARAKVEERRVQLEQEKGALIAQVVKVAIDSIQGLTPAQRQQGLVGAAGALRSLPGAA